MRGIQPSKTGATSGSSSTRAQTAPQWDQSSDLFRAPVQSSPEHQLVAASAPREFTDALTSHAKAVAAAQEKKGFLNRVACCHPGLDPGSRNGFNNGFNVGFQVLRRMQAKTTKAQFERPSLGLPRKP